MLLNSPELQLSCKAPIAPLCVAGALASWLWAMVSQSPGSCDSLLLFQPQKKKQKKKKALKHKSPLGREEMSKDAAVTQAHSHMPEDDARKRQSLCVHKHMLSLSCVHCSQMIWKNRFNGTSSSLLFIQEQDKMQNRSSGKSILLYISYKCCRTFNPYKYYAGNLPPKNQKHFCNPSRNCLGFCKSHTFDLPHFHSSRAANQPSTV